MNVELHLYKSDQDISKMISFIEQLIKDFEKEKRDLQDAIASKPDGNLYMALKLRDITSHISECVVALQLLTIGLEKYRLTTDDMKKYVQEHQNRDN